MATLACIGIFLGAALGLRFNVLVLAPAIGLTALIGAGAGIALDEATWSVMLTTALLASGLQLGYLGGAFVRHGIFPIRTSAATGRRRSA